MDVYIKLDHKKIHYVNRLSGMRNKVWETKKKTIWA